MKTTNMKQSETNQRIARPYKRPLVTVQPRQKYATVDLDTWNDGHFTLSPAAIEEIEQTLKRYGVMRWDKNHKGFYIHRVRIEVAAELAQHIAEVAARCRNCCSYSEWHTLTGRRAPLIGWEDRKGRPIPPPRSLNRKVRFYDKCCCDLVKMRLYYNSMDR